MNGYVLYGFEMLYRSTGDQRYFDYARRPEVEEVFRCLAAGLKRTQDVKTGRWFQVVDKGERKVAPVHREDENRFLATDALSRGPGLWSRWPGELKEFFAANERE